MTHEEAFDILFECYDKPVFAVKIGMCSPQVEWVDFKAALAEFSRCHPNFGSTELMEYVYIYVPEDIAYADRVNIALGVWGVGRGREGGS